jgi:hypothetical protein
MRAASRFGAPAPRPPRPRAVRRRQPGQERASPGSGIGGLRAPPPRRGAGQVDDYVWRKALRQSARVGVAIRAHGTSHGSTQKGRRLAAPRGVSAMQGEWTCAGSDVVWQFQPAWGCPDREKVAGQRRSSQPQCRREHRMRAKMGNGRGRDRCGRVRSSRNQPRQHRESAWSPLPAHAHPGGPRRSNDVCSGVVSRREASGLHPECGGVR